MDLPKYTATLKSSNISHPHDQVFNCSKKFLKILQNFNTISDLGTVAVWDNGSTQNRKVASSNITNAPYYALEPCHEISDVIHVKLDNKQ